MTKAAERSTNDFAFAMFDAMRAPSGNLIFSPFSIRAALEIARAGARGETAEQMRLLLDPESSDGAESSSFLALSRRLSASGGRAHELAVANSIWAQEGASLQPEFLERIAQDFQGGLESADFRRDAERARVAINRWVLDRTNRKIRNLIPPRGLGSDTRLVLANAVYLKGTWTYPFAPRGTRDEPFHLHGGGTVTAPLMRQREVFAYLQDDGYQAVELVYEGGALSMVVLLPEKSDGLPGLEHRFSSTMLQGCVAALERRQIDLVLPQFKIEPSRCDIGRLLAGLGMSAAFDPGAADFSGINGLRAPHEAALFLSAVFHSAFVEVNEMGTEAAAATIADLELGAAGLFFKPPPVPEFRADHPFVFAIRDRESGAILFLGRLMDPTMEKRRPA